MGRDSRAMNSTTSRAYPPQVPASRRRGRCLAALGVLQERPGWVKELLEGHSPEETPNPAGGSQSGDFLPPLPAGGPATAVPSRTCGAWISFRTWHLYVAPKSTRDPWIGCRFSKCLPSPEAGHVATLEREPYSSQGGGLHHHPKEPQVKDLTGPPLAQILPQWASQAAWCSQGTSVI